MRTFLLLTPMLFVAISTVAYGDTTSGENGQRFIDRKGEGFFWYKDPKEEAEPEETPEAPPPAKEPVDKKPAALPSGPAPMSASWLKANLPKYLDAAIDNPSEANVKAYLYLQHLSMEKASSFADASQEFSVGDPVLDGNNQRPLASFANDVVKKSAGANRDAVLQSIANKIGIFYFSDSSALSSAQDQVITYLTSSTDFTVVPIAYRSNKPFKSNQVPDSGHSTLMGITAAPALVVVLQDGTFDVIAQAPLSLSDLLDRVLLASKRLGLIDQKTFDTTRPIANRSPITLPVSHDASQLEIPASEIISRFKGTK
ncbi:MAG: hypothetical protein EOO52_13535 [Gammaproteobacteria bacterium]|nr:MAG: hypothetical protein EOO52_13535 [Gammaproteobacteria bacterium]